MGKNEAQIKYRKKAVKTIYLDLNQKTDADIIKWLNENAMKTATAIKNACRKRIALNMKESDIPGQKYQCPSCDEIYFPPSNGAIFAYCPCCGQCVRNQAKAKTEASTLVDTPAEESTPVDTPWEPAPLSKHELVARLGYDTTPENIFRDSWFVRRTQDGKVSYTTATPEQALDLYARIQKSGFAASSALKNYVHKLNQKASTLVNTGTEESTPVDTEPEASTLVNTEPKTCTPVEYMLKKAKEEGGKGDEYLITYVTKKGGETQRTAIFRGKNTKDAIKNFREWHKNRKEPFQGHAFRPEARRKFSKHGIPLLTEPEREAEARRYGKSLEQWDKETEEFWCKVDEETTAE